MVGTSGGEERAKPRSREYRGIRYDKGPLLESKTPEVQLALGALIKARVKPERMKTGNPSKTVVTSACIEP